MKRQLAALAIISAGAMWLPAVDLQLRASLRQLLGNTGTSAHKSQEQKQSQSMLGIVWQPESAHKHKLEHKLDRDIWLALAPDLQALGCLMAVSSSPR